MKVYMGIFPSPHQISFSFLLFRPPQPTDVSRYTIFSDETLSRLKDRFHLQSLDPPKANKLGL